MLITILSSLIDFKTISFKNRITYIEINHNKPSYRYVTLDFTLSSLGHRFTYTFGPNFNSIDPELIAVTD